MGSGGLTDAVATFLSEQTRGGTGVELVGTPEGRAGIGCAINWASRAL